MCVRQASWQAVVSGLSRNDATALATALEAGRVDWWRKAVAARIETLRSVHEHVALLAELQRNIARSVFRELERDARGDAGEMASRWPDSLSTAPRIRMLKTIRDLVAAPEPFRTRVNDAFIESELCRSRAFLDQVQAQPLTDEQRRAVVGDEDRNLVVAAAGSGKTSVFVAKAGWLARRGNRRPSELLLLAFAKDARNELAERIRERLGDEDVFAVLERQGRVDPFLRLVVTFLHHYKGAQLSFREVASRARGLDNRQRAKAFLAVLGPILERYQSTLSGRGEIDFDDMINKATEHVEAGRYRSPFGYILVDEFQDISPIRARLLKALLDQSPNAQLFAVGDDWQSIYRFGGADIAVMREFSERFGHSERIGLETTFRCSRPIADVATRFVLVNPSQIRKTVRSTRQLQGPCVHIGLSGVQGLPLLDDAFGRISADAAPYERPSSVLLLGRYKHMRPGNLASLARRHGHLQLAYKTMHGSKGLQADYIVVLGLCTGRHGFPTEIDDDPLLDLVLAKPEKHPDAEERRLFYVALTRARRHVFALAEAGPPSPFVLELLEGNYDVAIFGRLPEKEVPCPTCVRGHLVCRENARNKGAFYGCSNWPYCEHTQRPCPVCRRGLPVEAEGGFRCRDCGQRLKACPACDGWLQTRMSKYGRFLGCSNWPACDYTRDVERQRRGRLRSLGDVPRP